MKTHPLNSISIEEAKEKQFELVDSVTKFFRGNEILSRGDLGVVPGLNKPETTTRVEKVIADFFHTEDAMLVRGAGTMAIRNALYSTVKPNSRLLVHDAPIYPTSDVSLNMLSIKPVKVDFNDIEKVELVLKEKAIDGVLIQLTRQKPDDSYDAEQIIKIIRNQSSELPIITDDNYAVMKVPKIGCEMGATLSCFSSFKLLGPEGIGVVAGKQEYIGSLKKDNYSGGLQVQGHEALDVLKGMTYAPVTLAISAETSEKVCEQLNNGKIEGVKKAFIANAQSKVILIEFEKEIAKQVLKHANLLGASPYPIGAESQYELAPMFYRVSNTFLQFDHTFENKMIRVNPMRAGSKTILRILAEAVNQALINE